MEMVREVNEIIINPKIIKRVSPVGGCALTRRRKREKYNMDFNGKILTGSWDLTKQRVKNSRFHRDFLLFKENKESVYKWKNLYENIKKKGYIQDPNKRYIEVGIGRTGEILLVDGRHRLFCAQVLNIPEIPVDVIYVHPDYNFSNLKVIKNTLIPKIIYNKISKKWDKKIKVYQTHGTVKERLEFASKHLSILEGCKVLDIGCNAGMFIWSIMQHAKSLVALEKQEKYYTQAQITIKCLQSLWGNNKTVAVYNTTFKNYALNQKLDFDALVASFVLYHLNNEEILLLKEKVLPLCKKIVIPTRAKERRSQINSLALNREENVKKLFSEAGFTTKTHWHKIRGYFVLIGEKR